MAASARSILVAEDEKPMARALELKLSRAGFKIKVAYDGKEALEVLAKEKFDLVLLDLILPLVDGFGVLTEMKNRNDKTKVIVSSNLGQAEDINRAKLLGAVDYFIKSDTPLAEIVTKVESFLGNKK